MKTVVLFLALTLAALSAGCVTQLPQPASSDFYRDYNRARYGSTGAVPASR